MPMVSADGAEFLFGFKCEKQNLVFVRIEYGLNQV
jgi:hypothetical protein